jgi:hypothetical protein
MMKKILFLFITVLLWSCSEEGPDCFKSQGELKTEEISTEFFQKINISIGIELIVKEGEEQKILLTMGKNLIDDIQFEVVDGELKIENKNGCDMLRNYHAAKVYITTPQLEKIYSSSQYSIKSDGVLRFPHLTLESGIIEDTSASLFEMEIQNQRLEINDNISSVFKIKGKTEFLDVKFWGSNGRLEGKDFHAKEINVYHRSTNDMIVYPIEKISGKILSTGNLVLKNVPPTVEIEQLWTGHIVYP